MVDRTNTSIALYGEIRPDDVPTWKGFYDRTKLFMSDLGKPANFLGITGDSFHSDKILKLPRAEKRLFNSLDKAESIVSLELYTLPESYLTASFDYEILALRSLKEPTGMEYSYILISFDSELERLVSIEPFIKELKGFIEFARGQVFSMSQSESAAMYATGLTHAGAYETLKVLRTF